MPIYEYFCPVCRKVFEEWTKSVNDDTVEPCPQCGASSSRVMSHTSFVLKGGGWYVSDYGYRKGISDDGGQPDGRANNADKTAGNETTAEARATTGAKEANAASGAPAGKSTTSGKPAKRKKESTPTASRMESTSPQ
ncbi:MAG: zinc ribbon domain-containing protein [Desulfovibrio sp.]|nr:zinc ribbon domain-containing protein [Desulfovibrio sp.]